MPRPAFRPSRLRPILAAALGAAALAPVPLSGIAAAAPAAANLAVYDDLYAAMKEGTDQTRTIDAMTAILARQLSEANPDLVKADDAYPGMIAAVTSAVRPLVETYAQRVAQTYRPRMVAVIAQVLTPAEAREIAAFCRSPIGRKLMLGASLEPGVRPQPDAEAPAAELSRGDLEQLRQAALTSPAVGKLPLVSANLAALRVAAGKEPLTPAEEAELRRVVSSAAKAHLARFAKDRG